MLACRSAWRLVRNGCRALSSSATLWRGSSGVLEGERVRIGCSSGFWGDTAVAAPQLVHQGNIDFLVADYLSEITMSLLTAAKQKAPEYGYTPDFIQSMKLLLKDIKRKGVRVVANAGGVNTEACVEALQAIAREQGVELSVAMITGDDLMSQLKKMEALGVTEMDSGKPFPSGFHSMNAYLGAFPIAEALNLGADVVVTGRCVDSALALGPLIHKFGWKETDYDRLAAGSLAGHLIECGAQATGGVFTDWKDVDGWDNVGFPIVECAGDGSFFLTKPERTGGLVSKATVAEQLVYEIGDPKRYLLPDVTCDFSNVKLSEIQESGSTAVMVSGAKGKPPPESYKVSATYADGFRTVAVSPIIGPKAVAKARKTGEAIISRTRAIFKQLGLSDFEETNIHIVGSEASYGRAARKVDPKEVMLWLGVRHRQKKALEIFSREIAPAGTGMAPGQTTLVGGRPRVSPVLRLYSFLYPKDQLPITLDVNGEVKTLLYTSPKEEVSEEPVGTKKDDGSPLERGQLSFRLEELAYLRSGDKGDSANIGVVARHPGYLPYLKEALTVEAVQQYFSHLLVEDSSVERFDLPGISALNFVLKHSLGGGGVASIRVDPQGKAYAQMLADLVIADMPALSEVVSDFNLDSFAELN